MVQVYDTYGKIQLSDLVQIMQGITDLQDEVEQGVFYIKGAKFLKNGSPEFDEYIEIKKEILSYHWGEDPDQIEKKFAILRSQETLQLPSETPFEAIYHPSDGTYPDFGFVMNCDNLGVVYPAKKEIIIVPYDQPKMYAEVLQDRKSAICSGRELCYGGSLADALREFSNQGFHIKIGRHPKDSCDKREVMKKPWPERYIVEVENVPPEYVHDIIAQVNT